MPKGGSLILNVLSSKKRSFFEVILGMLWWCFHRMADVGSLKDWEIRGGHRSGKKPRVFRQTEFETNGFCCGRGEEIL